MLPADRQLARNQGLPDHRDERLAPERRGAVGFDDDAQHVLAVGDDGTGVLEGEPPRRDRLQRRRRVHEEGIPPRPGEDAHPIGVAGGVAVHQEGDHLAGRGDATARLFERLTAGTARRRSKVDVDGDLLRADGEGCRRSRRGGRDRSHAEAVGDGIGEERGRPGERQHVQHEREAPGPIGAWKGVQVGDVRGRHGQRPRPGDMMRHRTYFLITSDADSSSSLAQAGLAAERSAGPITRRPRQAGA